MQSYCVYVHRKISDGSIFYVGKGRGKKRANSKSARSALWKRIEQKHGRSVHIVVDGLSNEAACELESFLISEIGRDKLANFTDGGEGTPGRYVSKKTRELVSLKNKGIPPSPQAIEKALRKTRKPVVTLCGLRFESITSAARFVMPENPQAAKINISSCCNGVRGQSSAYGMKFRFEEDGLPYEGNHTKEKAIFNTGGESFYSAKDAAEWCKEIGIAKNSKTALSNIVSAMNGRLSSAYGYAWWRSGEDPKEYVSPSARRANTMGYKK